MEEAAGRGTGVKEGEESRNSDIFYQGDRVQGELTVGTGATKPQMFAFF